jgi:hypothetical protein
MRASAVTSRRLEPPTPRPGPPSCLSPVMAAQHLVPATAVALLRVTEVAWTAAPTGGASAKTLELAPTGTGSCRRFRLGGHEALPPGSTLLSPAVEVHACSRPRPRSRSRSRPGAGSCRRRRPPLDASSRDHGPALALCRVGTEPPNMVLLRTAEDGRRRTPVR